MTEPTANDRTTYPSLMNRRNQLPGAPSRATLARAPYCPFTEGQIARIENNQPSITMAGRDDETKLHDVFDLYTVEQNASPHVPATLPTDKVMAAFNTIFEKLAEEADNRDWCSEYREFLEELQAAVPGIKLGEPVEPGPWLVPVTITVSVAAKTPPDGLSTRRVARTVQDEITDWARSNFPELSSGFATVNPQMVAGWLASLPEDRLHDHPDFSGRVEVADYANEPDAAGDDGDESSRPKVTFDPRALA